MTADIAARVEKIAASIDTIERAYEYMLAYAAQGRVEDEGPFASIREHLGEVDKALVSIAAATVQNLGLEKEPTAASLGAFLEILRGDVARALTLFRLAAAQPAIASQTIDNLNASIHVRTLLTDLFILDETLKRFRSLA